MRRCWRRPRATGRRSRAACGSPEAVPSVAALDTLFPWLAHNAMMHLTVPHGLEQYTGAAWGTRDVCQGPVEFLLALEHDEPVKEILRIVFAQQYEMRAATGRNGSCSSPMPTIRDRHSHGDVIVWPLKALCDYVEATNDLAFLDEPVAWRREERFRADGAQGSASRAHVDEAARHRARALHSRHAADPLRRGRLERFAAAGRPEHARLDGQQLDGRAAVPAAQPLRRGAERAGRRRRSANDLRELAARDARRTSTGTSSATAPSPAMPCSIRARESPELLLHPSDTRTGLRYSLLPMTRSIIARAVHRGAGAAPSSPDPRAPAVSRRRAADGPAGRLSRRPGTGLPARRVGGVLRARDRPHVCSRPPSLRRGDGGPGRGRCALGGAAGGEPDHRHRAAGARLAAAAQRLFQQQRRRVSRPLPGERRVAAGQGRHDRRSTAAGGSIRAARAYTPTCCSPTPSASGGVSGSGL